MTNNTNKHTLPIWTEVEYTALCKNPYLSTPFFIPKESKVFLCKEDGSRKEQRMIFLVFKSTAAAEEDEWEDDPMPGEMWVKPLEDSRLKIELMQSVPSPGHANTFSTTIVPEISCGMLIPTATIQVCMEFFRICFTRISFWGSPLTFA